MFQGVLTEAHWQKIPADVLPRPYSRGGYCPKLGDLRRRPRGLFSSKEATRAHTEALATTEAVQAKATSSHAAAERQTRAIVEERSRVMREWDEGDRARAAEVTAAVQKS